MFLFLLRLNFIKSSEFVFVTDLDKLNIGIAIVHVMIFREFASVGFPAKVTGVNSLNGGIHLIRRYVIVVRIRSLVVSSFVYNNI